ncbi:MAG: barstar family protein [Caldilineales bacterium]|nr:barstar family protein [Caldilineales bacterium]MDW8317804.1 barstar family protein [Anaerolineae bacterium]
MPKLHALFDGQTPPGLYRVPATTPPERLRRQAEARGWRFFYVDGSSVADKPSFIRTVGDAMAFPAYSALNWDAFEESLRDLTWAPAAGYLVLFDEPDQFAARNPQQWATARAILEDAVAFWRAQGTPMVVLFRRAGRALPDVPWL